MSLTLALESVRTRRVLPNAIVLVFDDAFENLFRIARPLLLKYGLPYTVAVPASLPGTNQTIWSQAARLVILRAGLTSLRLSMPDGRKQVQLLTRQDRLDAARQFVLGLRSVDEAVRRSRLEEVWGQLPVGEWERLMDGFGELKIMTPEQLRQLRSDGAIIAAHGSQHIPLVDGVSDTILESEVGGAKAALEEMSGAPVDYFVYPYGVCCAAAVEKIRASKYRAALSAEPGPMRPGMDLFALPRVDAACSVVELKARLGACL